LPQLCGTGERTWDTTVQDVAILYPTAVDAVLSQLCCT